jgi:hypothetical protein
MIQFVASVVPVDASTQPVFRGGPWSAIEGWRAFRARGGENPTRSFSGLSGEGAK